MKEKGKATMAPFTIIDSNTFKQEEGSGESNIFSTRWMNHIAFTKDLENW